MRRLFLLITIVLLLPLASAYINTDSINLSYQAEGDIIIDHLSNEAKLIDLVQDVYLYFQNADYLESNFYRFTVIESGGLKWFRLNHTGDTNSLYWSLNAKIASKRLIYNLSSIPEFPFDTDKFPAWLKDYLKFTELIDYDDDLINKANELVSGATDYLDAVGRIASWVSSNIMYLPSVKLMTETLKATDVLISKEGVCDEYSVLFMSLARAVGIPVKYAYGYSYSDTIPGFGPHAWVEVYVPDFGWIPFDLTYKQYGWLDSSHLKTFSSYDVIRNIINASASAYPNKNHINIKYELPDYLLASLNTGAVGFITVESTANESIIFNSSISVNKQIFAEREYFLVNISVNNPYPYYVPVSFTLLTTSQMEFIDPQHNLMVLKPESVTSKYVILRTPPLGSAVIHPIKVKIPGSNPLYVNITVYPQREPTTSLETLKSIIESSDHPVTELEFKSLSIHPEVSYGETPFINLTLRNSGAMPINNLSIETSSSLTKTSSLNLSRLNINEVVNKLIPLELTGYYGSEEVNILVKSDAGTVSRSLRLTNAVKPLINLSVSGLRVFNKEDNLTFTLNIDNFNNQNISLITVSFRTPKTVITNTYYPGLNNLSLNFNLPVNLLSYGSNQVSFFVNYTDDYGTVFNDSLDANMVLSGAWYEFIIDWFSTIISIIINLFGGVNR